MPYTALAELFGESRVSMSAAVVAHRLVKRAGGRQNPHMAFGSRDGSVDEVPLQHDAVAGI